MCFIGALHHHPVAVDISRLIDQRGSASPPPTRRSPFERPDPTVLQSHSDGASSSSAIPSSHASSAPPSSTTFGTGASSSQTLPSYHHDGAESYGYASPYHPDSPGHVFVDSSLHPPAKRSSLGAHPLEQPAKKQSKWSNDEDRLIIQLRGGNMKWEEISKRLPGRSAISCRLHYQNFLERKAEWTQERDAKLARLYDR